MIAPEDTCRSPGDEPTVEPVITEHFYKDLDIFYAGFLEEPGIGTYVRLGGIPEEFEACVCLKLFRHMRTFVDVGTHTGLYCFLAAKEAPEGREIHCYEPQAACCEALRRTTELNSWQGIVHVHQSALGSAAGSSELTLSGTGSSLLNDFVGDRPRPKASVLVDTLDHQAEELGLENIDFIKIDVEGFELEVLRGGFRTITRDRPVLLIEIADRLRPEYENPTRRETLAWLRSVGYSIWRSKSGRLSTNVEARYTGVEMYWCLVPADHQDYLRVIERAVRNYRWARWKRRMTRIFRGRTPD